MNADVVGLLNDLLASEQRGLAPRLVEATPFLSGSSAATHALVRRMADATHRHAASLVTMILNLRGTPEPARPDSSTADLHYQELRHVLPRLLADQQRLISRYTLAVQRLGSHSRAAALVNSILQEHHRNLEALTNPTAAAELP